MACATALHTTAQHGLRCPAQLPAALLWCALMQNISADVVVIGAGIAGLSCAYNLAKEGGLPECDARNLVC